MYLDMVGKTLFLGDKVAYPTHDRGMRSELCTGELIGWKLRTVSRWDMNLRKRVQKDIAVAKIAKVTGSRRGQTNSTILLENTHNLLKIG